MLRWVKRMLAGGFARPPQAPPSAPQERLDEQMRAADACRRTGDLAGAERLGGAILEEEPDYAPALYLLGEIAALRSDHDAAGGLIRRALSIENGEPQYHYALGCVLGASGDLAGAEESYRGALALAPEHAGAHVNLGCILQARGESGAGAPGSVGERAERALEGAIAHFTAATQGAPEFTDGWINLGYALARQQRPEDARRSYDRALAIDPALALARFNRSMLLLALGQWPEGWDDYESRWPASGVSKPSFSRLEWDGSALAGKTILLYAEQGFGDAIQFVRFVAPVAAQGARVILRCQPQLQVLFKTVPGVSQTVTAEEPAPDFDVHCPLLSVPRILRTTVETIPADVPYLFSSAATAAGRKTQARNGGAGLRIGLVWASQSMFPGAALKSVPLDALAALGGIPGVTFYSLQEGEAGKPALLADAPLSMLELAHGIRDFSDTAALIADLDLTISVDTAVAHLAGAMGRPIWTLLPYAADWRWEPAAGASRWYPTMRLFRQQRRGNWAEVLNRVADHLREMSRAATTSRT